MYDHTPDTARTPHNTTRIGQRRGASFTKATRRCYYYVSITDNSAGSVITYYIGKKYVRVRCIKYCAVTPAILTRHRNISANVYNIIIIIMERRAVRIARSPASRRPIKGQTVFFFFYILIILLFYTCIYIHSTFTDANVPIIIYERKTALETFRSEIIVRARRDDQTGRGGGGGGGVNTVDLAATAIFPVEGATGAAPPPYAPHPPPTTHRPSRARVPRGEGWGGEEIDSLIACESL